MELQNLANMGKLYLLKQSTTGSKGANQFQKKLVCWNQYEKFYLLIKFEENLRWWVDWLGQLTWNEPYVYFSFKKTQIC